jgi:hypothetical protein
VDHACSTTILFRLRRGSGKHRSTPMTFPWANLSQGKSFNEFEVNWGEHRWAPFDVTIKVRSPEHAALIDREGRIAVDTKY